MGERFCPILSVWGGDVKCRMEECEWFDLEDDFCAIFSQVRCLVRLEEEMKKMRR